MVKGAVSDELLARGLAGTVRLDEAGVGWAVRDHVVVVSAAGAADANAIADNAGTARQNLTAAIDHADLRRVLVLRPKDAAQVQSWTGRPMPTNAAAVTVGSGTAPSLVVIDPTAWRNQPGQRDHVIGHELVHALARTADQPLWVLEGYAQWLSQALLAPGTLEYPVGAHLPSDTELLSGTTAQSDEAYWLAAAFFQYLATTHGNQKVGAFYRASLTTPTATAFRATFGITQAEATAEWQRTFTRSVTFSY